MADPHSQSRSTKCCGCQGSGEEADGHNDTTGVTRAELWLVGLSGAAITAGFIAKWSAPDWPWMATLCYATATAAGGSLIFPHAAAAMRKLRLDMNVLMTVAVAGAWLIGEGAEGAAVVFLFALAELLEAWSVGRARRAIKSLMALTPETALRKLDGRDPEEVPSAEVGIGEIILVRSGQRIPLDGVISRGVSAINQASITGESVPVDKKPGDTVFAGTINGEGSIEVQVSKLTGDSTLARIIKMVEEAEEQKAPTQRFVDRFARVYTPAVFALAIIIAVFPPLLTEGSWNDWGYRALVLLVIACPCALVIATPVSIVSGLTNLARKGVLIKGGAFLEILGKIRALAVDKTGTITQGLPRVETVIAWGENTEQDVLRLAVAIDSHSSHPLAQAVTTAAKERGIIFGEAENFQSKTGRGAEAEIDGIRYFIGNHKMAHELGACSPELEARLGEIEERGLSLAILGQKISGQILGIISIGDTMRPEVPQALKMLHAAGVESVVILSGDNQRTVNAVAAQAGIDLAIGDLMPDQKLEHVRQLVSQFAYVGMIGDGVNDAPALAVASVGIAMGAVGSDTAIETADMALMNDDLRKLADAIFVARRTMGIIRFNVGFALAVKALFLTLAFTGHASLWMAILADTGATLFVVANALRLLRTPAAP